MPDPCRPEDDHQPLYGFRAVRHTKGSEGESSVLCLTSVLSYMYNYRIRIRKKRDAVCEYLWDSLLACSQ